MAEVEDELAKKVVRVVAEACGDIVTVVSAASSSSSAVGPAWEEHRMREAELTAWTGGATDGQVMTSAASLEEAEAAFRESTRNLCQALRSGLQIQQSSGRLSSARSASSDASLSATTKAFLELIGSVAAITTERMVVDPHEDAEKRKGYEEWAEAMRKKETAFAKRTEALRENRAAHARDTEQRAALIQRLKDEIAEVEQAGLVESRMAQNEAKTKEADEAKALKEKEEAFAKERDKLAAALDAASKANKKREHELRKKKQRTETEAQNWVKRYDTELGELETTQTGIEEEYRKEKEELDVAEAEAAKLTAERDELLAEENRRAAVQARELDRRRKVEEAARTIQRSWRRHRKLLKTKHDRTAEIGSRRKARSRQGGAPPSRAKSAVSVASDQQKRPASTSSQLPAIQKPAGSRASSAAAAVGTSASAAGTLPPLSASGNLTASQGSMGKPRTPSAASSRPQSQPQQQQQQTPPSASAPAPAPQP